MSLCHIKSVVVLNKLQVMSQHTGAAWLGSDLRGHKMGGNTCLWRKDKTESACQKQVHVFPVHKRHFALFMCLLVICTSLFEKCLFHSFASFSVWSRHFWFFSFLVWILISGQMNTLLRFFPSLQSVFSTCFFCCAKAFKCNAIPFGNLFHYFLSYCWSI